MPSVLTYFRRWRNSRGFGVHSPFAFAFITDVLRQRCAYYAYEQLANEAAVRTLFRVALHLRPNSIAVFADSKWRKAVELACVKAHISDNIADADFIVIDLAKHPEIDPTQYVGKHVVAVGRARNSWRDLLNAMPNGMTFDNGKTIAIAVAYRHLPRQDFKLFF